MNDENEILKMSCDKCKEFKLGTYEELFGDIPSIMVLPKMVCVCGGNICLKFTNEYREAQWRERA